MKVTKSFLKTISIFAQLILRVTLVLIFENLGPFLSKRMKINMFENF